SSNTSKTGSANDVTFSTATGVSGRVYLTITADSDVVGYALTSNLNAVTWLNSSSDETGVFSFTPGGDFVLVGNNDGCSSSLVSSCGGNTFYSDTADGGTSDNVSHFAFFDPPAAVPEPSSVFLLGTLVALVGVRM